LCVPCEELFPTTHCLLTHNHNVCTTFAIFHPAFQMCCRR
jgi:hypothetical protein